jgi:lipoate-protein ligase A
MDGTASTKVPDGKLVTVAVTYGDRIESVTITGDFFLEPPEARSDLEAAIEGHPTDVSRERLHTAIEDVDAQLIGFGVADLADITLEALE